MARATGAPSRREVGLTRVNDYLWRIAAPTGHILGHIERTATPQGDVFVAKRFSPSAARFVALGQFWNMDDAIDCLCGM